MAPLARLGVQVERRADGTPGVQIEEVLTGGPGAMAGLRRGDTITELSGRMTTRVDQLAELLLETTDDHLSMAYLDPAGRQHITVVGLAGTRLARLGRSRPGRVGFIANAPPNSDDE